MAYLERACMWATELLLIFKKKQTRNKLQIWVCCQNSDFQLHKNL